MFYKLLVADIKITIEWTEKGREAREPVFVAPHTEVYRSSSGIGLLSTCRQVREEPNPSSLLPSLFACCGYSTD
jgi:hypothetical protein